MPCAESCFAMAAVVPTGISEIRHVVDDRVVALQQHLQRRFTVGPAERPFADHPVPDRGGRDLRAGGQQRQGFTGRP